MGIKFLFLPQGFKLFGLSENRSFLFAQAHVRRGSLTAAAFQAMATQKLGREDNFGYVTRPISTLGLFVRALVDREELNLDSPWLSIMTKEVAVSSLIFSLSLSLDLFLHFLLAECVEWVCTVVPFPFFWTNDSLTVLATVSALGGWLLGRFHFFCCCCKQY